LTSLRSMLAESAQKVLISAVISNAKSIGEWLNGTNSEIVEGSNLIPTFRSVGFASWRDRLGRIEYVASLDPEQTEFFVPRVIESLPLKRKSAKEKDRIFPEKSDGQSIALYLGLKLVSKGSVAIFCGRKTTAASLCQRVIDLIERDVPFRLPSAYSDQDELRRLHYLHLQNLGAEAAATRCSEHGVVSHHGALPHGIRLAVEHSMREDLVRFVICTSTLAQGVNLPIRYLIVTSVYQGVERIKVRDFHNLIGRAGRAGMHTEGSILFADPVVYDHRRTRKDGWRWLQVKQLLDAKKAEPCISNLLSVFDPIESDDHKHAIQMGAMDFVNAYVNDPDAVTNLAEQIASEHKNFSKASVENQIAWKLNLISAVESFLLSNWDVNKATISREELVALAESTLAYFLAREEQQENIRNLFTLLAENISKRIVSPKRRRAFGKTLYGIRDAQLIEAWVEANVDELKSQNLLEVVWPIVASNIHNSVFVKCDQPAALLDVARAWVLGEPFHILHSIIEAAGAKLIWGTKRRAFKIEHIVELCESGLAYDGSLVAGALVEFARLNEDDESNELISRLRLFQKRLKYGLPTSGPITLYELGFRDRAIALELASTLSVESQNKTEVVKLLHDMKDQVLEVLGKYPRYFLQKLVEILATD
jgi:POLQ-like helicase